MSESLQTSTTALQRKGTVNGAGPKGCGRGSVALRFRSELVGRLGRRTKRGGWYNDLLATYEQFALDILLATNHVDRDGRSIHIFLLNKYLNTTHLFGL